MTENSTIIHFKKTVLHNICEVSTLAKRTPEFDSSFEKRFFPELFLTLHSTPQDYGRQLFYTVSEK